jgi:hypothetical protein
VTADDYLSRVDAALRDLPWSQRRELLAELRSHLAELPAGTDLRELGTPEEYAADLRSAAGLERRHGPVAFLRARRPRNVLLTLLALTVIGLAIGAVAWIQSYQPISFAGASQLPDDSRPALGATETRSSSVRGVPSNTASRFRTRVGSRCGYSAFQTCPGPSHSRPGC